MNQDKNVLGSQVSSMNACREKEWEEMDILEKIERLKRVVDMLSKDNKKQNVQIYNLLNHDHLDGRTVIPLQHIF